MSRYRKRLQRLEAFVGPEYLPTFELWTRCETDPERFELTDLRNPERDGETATEVELAHRALATPRPFALLVEGWDVAGSIAGDQGPSARRVLAARGTEP